MSLSRSPVFWLTVVAIAIQAIADSAATALLPPPWPTVVMLLGVAATAIVGRMAHDRATPVANPRDNLGRALVPAVRTPRPSTQHAEDQAVEGLDEFD